MSLKHFPDGKMNSCFERLVFVASSNGRCVRFGLFCLLLEKAVQFWQLVVSNGGGASEC